MREECPVRAARYFTLPIRGITVAENADDNARKGIKNGMNAADSRFHSISSKKNRKSTAGSAQPCFFYTSGD
jgi:hypothetical protein